MNKKEILNIIGSSIFGYMVINSIAYTAKILLADLLILQDAGVLAYWIVKESVYWLVLLVLFYYFTSFIVKLATSKTTGLKHMPLKLLLIYLIIQTTDFFYTLNYERMFSLEFAERRIEYLRDPISLQLAGYYSLATMFIGCLVIWLIVSRK